MSKTYIIAEAGVNHNGKISNAKSLIEYASKAGADAIKFQMFSATELVTSSAETANYQKKNLKSCISQKEMLSQLELQKSDFVELNNYCRKLHIDFLCTPFDVDALHFLVKDLKLKTIKISSPDILNGQLLFEAAKLGVSTIISSGMANLGEIEYALSVLAAGYCFPTETPNTENLVRFYNHKDAQKCIEQKVTILHCNSDYPTSLSDVNLNALTTLQNTFQNPIGFSDHTIDLDISIAAVALGATVIEKHFTIDKTLPGPDHLASLNPQELKDMILKIRKVEQALGSYVKWPTLSEYKNIESVRRSLFANKKIKKGERFTEENLSLKRPGHGISSQYYWDYIGKIAKKSYKKDDLIEN